jgi:hypothetical protein
VRDPVARVSRRDDETRLDDRREERGVIVHVSEEDERGAVTRGRA